MPRRRAVSRIAAIIDVNVRTIPEEYSGGLAGRGYNPGVPAAHACAVGWSSEMSASRLRIEERRAGDVTILTLMGEMRLDDGDLAFRRKIHDLIADQRVKIVVDLDGVTSIDSSGVGMMAAKLKTVRESGGDLRLLHLNARGQRLLTLAKLKTAFETFDDEQAALRSFEFRPHA